MRYLVDEEIDRLDYNIRKIGASEEHTDLEYCDSQKNDILDSYWDRIASIKNSEKPLDTLLKTSILYWNIASKRIDLIYYILDAEKKLGGSMKCHILDIKGNIDIIDLETNNSAMCPGSSEKKSTYLLRDVLLGSMENPFSVFVHAMHFIAQASKLKQKAMRNY